MSYLGRDYFFCSNCDGEIKDEEGDLHFCKWCEPNCHYCKDCELKLDEGWKEPARLPPDIRREAEEILRRKHSPDVVLSQEELGRRVAALDFSKYDHGDVVDIGDGYTAVVCDGGPDCPLEHDLE